MLKKLTILIGSTTLLFAFSVVGTVHGQEVSGNPCCQSSTGGGQNCGSQCETKPGKGQKGSGVGCSQSQGKEYGKQGSHEKRGERKFRRQRRGKQGGAGMRGQRGGHGGMPSVMQGAHTLIMDHSSLTREVIEIPDGVRTINTTTDPKLVPVLQSHPREMDQHLSKGGRVRNWDPFFAEIAKHHDKITMTFKNLDNGIEVISTSKDPNVVKLIQAHAHKVSEFVSRGREAAHETTPLPEGYIPPSPDK